MSSFLRGVWDNTYGLLVDDGQRALEGPATEVVDLGVGMLLPGFIDAHTHFGNAAAWVSRVALYEARDADTVASIVARAAGRVAKGLWITGGDIGAAIAWEAEARS